MDFFGRQVHPLCHGWLSVRAELIKFKLQKVYNYKSRGVLVSLIIGFILCGMFVIVMYVIKEKSPVLTSFTCCTFYKACAETHNFESTL